MINHKLLVINGWRSLGIAFPGALSCFQVPPPRLNQSATHGAFPNFTPGRLLASVCFANRKAPPTFSKFHHC